MLDRDYFLSKPDDLNELLRRAPSVIRGILNLVYRHNELSSRIGYKLNGKVHGEGVMDQYQREQTSKLILERQALFETIGKYCRVIGYTPKLMMGNRIANLRPRAKRGRGHAVSRAVGSIWNISQKALFVFKDQVDERSTRDLIVDIILAGDDHA